MCAFQDAYVITAGSDATMRYFDVREPSDGYRISAPDTWPNHQPYTNVMCTASNEQNAVVFDESISLDEAAMYIFFSVLLIQSFRLQFHDFVNSGLRSSHLLVLLLRGHFSTSVAAVLKAHRLIIPMQLLT
jgi:hypothetical protein